jgi:hypothetical protein
MKPSYDFNTTTAYAQTWSPGPPSSCAESTSSSNFPDVEPATSMDDRSIDATARLMAEAGFLLGPYTLSGVNGDSWDQCDQNSLKGEEIDELMADAFEQSTATAYVMPADPRL